jgi:hypothetical protein
MSELKPFIALEEPRERDEKHCIEEQYPIKCILLI